MLRALMFILPLALTIYACIDCVTTPEEETKHLPKLAWVVLILLFPIAAPIVWFFAGKDRRRGFTAGGRGANQWVAPDDNPEFLKSLREDEKPPRAADEPKDEEPSEQDEQDRDKDK
ncbi:PLDc N-terminal domain-containing protein [Streptomyces sp. Je 1-79]|uniref:PLDc N-terminal domain-containing protein n=1 Tax=Streptomyces sp. Je 1-79 TaxID=2943847 RepID=UPI0021A81A63|nr:PLDc N-terminal domain-containing protein [Streptomyces sp. Je 1-79]MCT4356367.1 PLDc N-terminal domain-containing protein [Streptomyces sp. Je 1-79]